MTFRKSILLLIGLGMIAALVACSSSSHKTIPAVVIAATSGTPQSATVGTAFAAPLGATVTTGGTPTSGVMVTFTAPANGASGTFAGGTATETDTTNASGVATSSTFTANTTAGAYTATASTTGASTAASFSLTNTAAAPAAITATGGATQSAVVSTAFAAPLAATVVDSNNNPVSGVVVTFTAPGSGASGAFANGTGTEMDTTNASGVATSMTFTANSTVGGPYTVTAMAAGVPTAANFSLTNTVPVVVAISATGGTPQSATVGTAFATPLAATVTTNGTPTSGVTVTFTAPATGASGTFADTTTNTTTAMTNASGVATSAVFTANSTAGGPYTVTGTAAGAPTPANFSLTNKASIATTLGDGTYVFSLAGQDTITAYLYYVAGVFTVSGGVVTGGEQDFVDYNKYAFDPITGGAVTTTADANLQITLTGTSVGVGGTETLNATLVSSTRALINEFDSSATSSGELDLQTSTKASQGGYAFLVNGGDANGFAAGIGGVVNVDGQGTISGAGSVFDINDYGSGVVLQNQPIDPSTASSADSFGRFTISLVLTTSGVQGIGLVGYNVDGNRIRLVENSNDPNDIFFGVTGGTAFFQGASTGTFSASSIEGSSFVFGANGQDTTGYFQVAGVLTTNVDGTTVSGTLNLNDLTGTGVQAPIPITGTYTVDSTGRVTLSNLTGTGVSGAMQLYLSGGSHAFMVTIDNTDEAAGPAFLQTGGGSFTTGSFAGSYGFDATGYGLPISSGPEFDAVGPVSSDGVSVLTGTFDQNIVLGAQTAGLTLTDGFTAKASGVFTGTLTGLDVTTPANQGAFTYYLIDTTKVVAIETDPNQLTLGYFELQQ